MRTTSAIPAIAALLFAHATTLVADAPTTQPISTLVESKSGDLPILISAPHGGTDAVPGVAARRGKGVSQFVTVTDTNTDRLAEMLAASIERRTGAKPYLVIAHFDRKYIDANRDEANAYESPAAAIHYRAYHAAMQADCDDIVRRFGRGLVIDLHGQGVDANVNFRGTQNGKSVDHLVHDFGIDALVGPDSVIGQMQARGYSFLPGSTRDDVGTETKFDGGFITATYGAAHQPHMDAIQFETGATLRDTPEHRQKTADDLAAAIDGFAKRYLGVEATTRPATR